jgi:two-component system sensor histidine kinase BarA
VHDKKQEVDVLKVIDLEMGAKILGGDEQMAKSMLAMLVSTLDETHEKLLDAYQSKHYDRLEFVVHKLHGGAAYCGVPQLKDCAKRLEYVLKSQDMDQLDDAWIALSLALKSVLEAYSRLDA